MEELIPDVQNVWLVGPMTGQTTRDPRLTYKYVDLRVRIVNLADTPLSRH
jgi:hypothetical protein